MGVTKTRFAVAQTFFVLCHSNYVYCYKSGIFLSVPLRHGRKDIITLAPALLGANNASVRQLAVEAGRR